MISYDKVLYFLKEVIFLLKDRYDRNMNCFSREELDILLTKKVGVVGCGGLGGFVIQSISRLGIASLTIIDGDQFQSSNLNRQVFCTEQNLGQNKVDVVKCELEKINSDLQVNAYSCLLNEDNINTIFNDVDIIIDCVDNIPTRKLLASFANKKNIPLIHGAIGGLYGQVSTILPGDQTMQILYPDDKDIKTIEQRLGNPSFTPMCIASLQVGECVKCLLDDPNILHRKVLYVDLLRNEFEIIELKQE